MERKGKVAEPKGKFKSSEMVVDSDSDDAAIATQNENTRLAEKFNDADDDQEETSAVVDDEDAVVEKRRKKPGRIIDEDDEDEEDATTPPAPATEDVSMVDETAPAAGNENASDL